MDLQYFDRYQFFVDGNDFKPVPGIEIPIKSTDKYLQYKKNKDRLDKWSQAQYGTPFFGWLIMLANPSLGSIESDIPDNSIVRIPFPLVTTLQDYKKNIDLYKTYYGED